MGEYVIPQFFRVSARPKIDIPPPNANKRLPLRQSNFFLYIEGIKDRRLNNFPISRDCHFRMLLAGIQSFKACGCPIKAFGHDDHLGKLFNQHS